MTKRFTPSNFFGNMMNAVYSANAPDLKPVIGMGATQLLWSDRVANTIVAVEELTGKRYSHLIHLRRDKATRIDDGGMSDAQAYSYLPGDPQRPTVPYARMRKSGAWIRVVHAEGSGKLVSFFEGASNVNQLVLDTRNEYYDFSC